MSAAPAEPDLDAIVAFARDLVAIPTENPPGAAYDDCIERISAELGALGIDHEVVDTGDGDTRRRAVLGHVGDAGPLLYLHGHYDVVPAFDRGQFEPRVEDGRLVGRGATDMKGGLAALGRLDPDAAGAIVAEPTWGTIWHACRGAFTLRVRLRGRPAHVGLHYEGENAFAAAVDVALALRELERELGERRSALAFEATDPRASESIMLVGGRAEGGTNFNIVPGTFEFTIDRRPNPEEDYEAAKRELLEQLGDVDYEVLQDATSAITPADDDFVRTVAASASAVTGAAPSVTCCPGVLETRIYHRLGVPAVAFGPGLIDRMHGPEEDVPIANLAAAAHIYTEVARSLA